ncbi:uncharacterized protein LOC129732002 [Wyeomyia smithii]|uniref:uncharacterized protein LOC129732002 n=1 Tax=Wyeomyia smithii TaxID=174621 RepID=UPI002467DC9E|nr:uncharacterized protein LOC129732002 [Wyeomyia smithii]
MPQFTKRKLAAILREQRKSLNNYLDDPLAWTFLDPWRRDRQAANNDDIQDNLISQTDPHIREDNETVENGLSSGQSESNSMFYSTDEPEADIRFGMTNPDISIENDLSYFPISRLKTIETKIRGVQFEELLQECCCRVCMAWKSYYERLTVIK